MWAAIRPRPPLTPPDVMNQLASASDGETELCGKIERALSEGLFEFGSQRLRLVTNIPERRHQNVAPAFDIGIGIEQPQQCKSIEQSAMALFTDAPDLEVGAARHVDETVAVAFCEFGKPGNLRHVEPSAERAHAHHEPIARLHRPQRAGTPALDRHRAHDASRSAAAIELRRVRQSEASCRRVKQLSIAASAAGFSRAMKPRISSFPSVAS
jgi:hypothetical protein